MVKLTEKKFIFHSKDQREIFVYQWLPDDKEIKGVVQISHGMAETASRYRVFAKKLTENGFVVYANDHRGHGKSADSMKHLGYLGENDGFNLLITDMLDLTEQIRRDYPNLPVFLFSHSMGSFAAQKYIMNDARKINGLILSGSNGRQGMSLVIGKFLAKMEVKLRGKKAKSKLINALTFDRYNKYFKNRTTGVEWLTRDKEEQEKYLSDPYCGAVFPASFYYDFFNTLQDIENPTNFYKIPKDLPIYIISGSEDPVGDSGNGVAELKKRYKKRGVRDLKMKLYEGARHEILNEINREEVMKDIIDWLESKL